MSSLKEIPLVDVRLGMFIHDVGLSWVSHPFWRRRFLLESLDDLRTLRELGVSTIWIDASRGVDVREPARSILDGERFGRDGMAMGPRDAPDPERAPLVPELDPVAAAAALCERARGVVIRMFEDARIGGGIDADTVGTLVDDIDHSLASHPSALLSLVRLKTADDYTYLHSVAVAALMVAFARHMDMDVERVRLAGMAGLLHDVGKALLPLEVLNKPSVLTTTEVTTMRKHPELGHRLLVKRGGVPSDVLIACLHHHEKFDGSGYPHGLIGEQISRLARMASICDVYDAVTSERPYKKPWDPAFAVQRMAGWAGHFDPRLFRAFVRTVGIYPIGALVRLESGYLAVVLDGSRASLTQPLVRVFHSMVTGQRVEAFVLDLAEPGCEDRIAAKEPRTEWPEAELTRLALP